MKALKSKHFLTFKLLEGRSYKQMSNVFMIWVGYTKWCLINDFESIENENDS